MPEPSILATRRSLLAAFGGVATLSALNGPAESAESVQIRFGIFGNAEKLKARRAAITRFNETHSDIRVAFEGIPSATWPDKIAAMVAGGTAPDVITLSQDTLPQYVARGALSPIDPFVPGIFRADLFEKNVLDLGRLDGKLYGVPIAVSIQAIGYNQSALQRLGMVEPPPSWTYDDFARVCAEIHRADNRIYGSHDGAATLEVFEMYLISQGRQLYEGGHLAVGVDDVAQWLGYWDAMRKSGAAVPADLQAQFTGTEWPNSPLVRGKAVFAPLHSQDLSGGYQALTKDTLSITTPPSAAPGKSPGYYPQPTSSLCLNAKSQHKEATVKVMDWFVSDPDSARALGLISGPPASKPALAVVQAMPDLAPVDQRVLKYSQAALAKAEPAPPPQLAEPAIADLMRRINEDVGFGRSSVKDAAQAFVDRGAALIRRA